MAAFIVSQSQTYQPPVPKTVGSMVLNETSYMAKDYFVVDQNLGLYVLLAGVVYDITIFNYLTVSLLADGYHVTCPTAIASFLQDTSASYAANASYAAVVALTLV